jgi:hypothetical protein
LDLGAATQINTVTLYWENAYAVEYDLQVADSLVGPWTTLIAITLSDGDVDILDGFDVVTQYVRILGHVRGAHRVLTAIYGASLWEIEILGCPV